MQSTSARPIVMFGSTRRKFWDVNRQRHQEIVERLASARDVTYLELSVTRNPRLAGMRESLANATSRRRNAGNFRRSEFMLDVPGLRFVTPCVAPVREVPGIRWASKRSLLRQLVRLSGLCPPGEETVIWACQPSDYVVDAIGAFNRAFVVYDVAQFYRHSTHMEPRVSIHEDWLVRRADLVIVDSPHLADLLNVPSERLLVVPQGVDAQLINEPRAAAGRQPIVGYLGSRNQAFDDHLFVAVAELLPTVTFELVGDFESPASMPNVRALGPVPHEELASVLDRWTAGLIPYKVNDFTGGVLPTKVLEYLARGCRVVSTSLPALESVAFPGIAYANGPEEFAASIRAALENPLAAESLRSWLLGQTWDIRFDAIASRLAEMGVRVGGQSRE